MNTRHTLFPLACATLLAGLALPLQAKDWTLSAVLQEARRSHPSVRLRQSELQVATTELQTARWGRYPRSRGWESLGRHLALDATLSA